MRTDAQAGRSLAPLGMTDHRVIPRACSARGIGRPSWLLVLFPLLAAAARLPAQANDSTALPVTFSGYVTTSLTSSNHAAASSIVGRLYGRRQNEFMLNVGNLTVDRAAPTDRFGAGAHVELFFGQDAEVIKSNGLDLGADADIWQAFVTLNLPGSDASHYVQFKAGKMATLMGVEVGEDVQNANLEVGSQDILLEPFTETGAELDGHFGANVDAELRLSNGWDQVTDVNTAKTIMLRLGLVPDPRSLVAIVGYSGAERPDSNGPKRSGVNVVLSRKVGSAASLAAQFDYGQEAGLAADGNAATWWAAGVWATVDIASHLTLAVRGDYLDDRDGARTSGVLGFPVNAGQKLSSLTATLNIKQWRQALLRPEIRYDHSTLPVFNGFHDQVSLAIGTSVLF